MLLTPSNPSDPSFMTAIPLIGFQYPPLQEAHRKAISSYKIEFQSVVEAMARKINDKMAGMQQQAEAMSEFRTGVEEFLVRQEHEAGQMLAQMQFVEEGCEEVRRLAERSDAQSGVWVS